MSLEKCFYISENVNVDSVLKILIDQNLPVKVKSAFSVDDFKAMHVTELDLQQQDDITIWNYAREFNLAILTKDKDFKYLSGKFGCPPKVVHVRCGNQNTVYITNLIDQKLKTIFAFLRAFDKVCYLELY